ncbi:MAG: hypothetical protein ACKVS8_13360 [Phycisphaerales bacterium]
MKLAFLLLVLALALAGGGCQSGARVAGHTPPAIKASFDQLKTLDGEWESVDEKGQISVAAVFKTTAAGSAVREIMFPGGTHEMTNMYHLDGDSLMATHYCAVGNQPRMRCTRPAGGVYMFNTADVTNLSSRDTEYMAELRLIVQDKDHIRQEWQSFKNGEKTESVVFELTRKK